jgi:6-pyruvoyltetrahydropterin/6-carboxytetrahydropterin synthase
MGTVKRVVITKKFHFDAGHRIWNENLLHDIKKANINANNIKIQSNKCANPHGHTFYVEVSFSAPSLNEQGMVVNTDLIKIIVDEIIDKLDHSFIIHSRDPLRKKIEELFNGYKISIIDVMPTCEGISYFLFREIRKKISKSSIKGVKLESVEVTIANSIKSTFQQ